MKTYFSLTIDSDDPPIADVMHLVHSLNRYGYRIDWFLSGDTLEDAEVVEVKEEPNEKLYRVVKERLRPYENVPVLTWDKLATHAALYDDNGHRGEIEEVNGIVLIRIFIDREDMYGYGPSKGWLQLKDKDQVVSIFAYAIN